MNLEDIRSAVETAINNSKPRKFTESVDLAINLKDIDMKKPENRIDVEVILPHPFKETKIAAFADGEIAVGAEEYGVKVLSSDQVSKVDENEAKKLAEDFDSFIAEAHLMPSIGKSLGPILGPRNKMPTPIPPGTDLKSILDRLRERVRIRSREKTIHLSVGKENMDPSEIAENINEVLRSLANNLENGMQNIQSAHVKTTMGPSARI